MTVGTFIKPQLAAVPKAKLPSRDELDNGSKWVAEPKLDGQRIQIHVEAFRTVAAFSRTGHSLMGQKNLAWLRGVTWPVASAILDGEAYVGDGKLAGRSVDSMRAAGEDDRASVTLFDLLHLDGENVMPQPWDERRAKLERIEVLGLPARVTLTPVSPSWRDMWATWVEQFGGEGVLVKARDSKYVPGWRSPYWIKVKQELTVDVVITGTTERPTYQKEGFRTAEAALTYGYFDRASGKVVTVGQGLKFGKAAELAQFIGQVAEVLCNGVMEGGALRHLRLLRFRDDKPVEECEVPEVAAA